MRKRRTERTFVTRGTAFAGPSIPPPSRHDPNVPTEWNLLRLENGTWVNQGSATGPSWMPDSLNAAVIWIAWVVFGQPRPM